jgi:type II secretory pathway predicted ATPase ExeA
MCYIDPKDAAACLTPKGNINHRMLAALYKRRNDGMHRVLVELRQENKSLKERLARLENRTRTKEQPLRLVG